MNIKIPESFDSGILLILQGVSVRGEGFDAMGADQLSLEVDHVFQLAAKNAGRGVFLQDNAVVFGESLKMISTLDVQRLANLLGNYKTSQIVDLSYNTGSLHNAVPFPKLTILSIVCYHNRRRLSRGLVKLILKNTKNGK